jgi:type I restriction enzyme M protein
VERPLRLSTDLSKEKINAFSTISEAQNEFDIVKVVSDLAEKLQYVKLNDYNCFVTELSKVADRLNVKLTAKRLNLIRTNLTDVDETAEKVIKKVYKAGKIDTNPLKGLFNVDMDGKSCVVEYEADGNLRDTEQIPLSYGGGIEQFFKNEILSFASDAWIDESKTQIGYEINFSRYFYKPIQLRTLDEIKAEIYELETETEGLLEQVIGRRE